VALGADAGSGGGALPFGRALACACGAGALASWVTTPLDLAKMRMQAPGRPDFFGCLFEATRGSVAQVVF